MKKSLLLFALLPGFIQMAFSQTKDDRYYDNLFLSPFNYNSHYLIYQSTSYLKFDTVKVMASSRGNGYCIPDVTPSFMQNDLISLRPTKYKYDIISHQFKAY